MRITVRTSSSLRGGICVAACLALLSTISGCSMTGSGSITVVGANPVSGTLTGPTAATTAVAAASSTQLKACSAADLHLNDIELPPAAPPTGSPNSTARTRTLTLSLVFTNDTRFACTLRGYPSIDFLRSANRGPLSAPDTFTPARDVPRVSLLPGGSASALMSFVTNGPANPRGARCDLVARTRVFPPSSPVALSAGLRAPAGDVLPSFYVCDHDVSVWPVQPWSEQ